MNKEYLYIGENYNSYKKESIAPEGKKVGVTNDINRRKKDYDTNNFLGVRFIKAWQYEKSDRVESLIHALLDSSRLPSATGRRSEWFEDEDGTLVDRITKAIDNLSEMMPGKITLVDLMEIKEDVSSRRIRQTDVEKQNKIKELYDTHNCQDHDMSITKDYIGSGRFQDIGVPGISINIEGFNGRGNWLRIGTLKNIRNRSEFEQYIDENYAIKSKDAVETITFSQNDEFKPVLDNLLKLKAELIAGRVPGIN